LGISPLDHDDLLLTRGFAADKFYDFGQFGR
jgi:hypothetical protein